MALEKLGVQAVIEGLNSYLGGMKKMDKATQEVGDEAKKTQKKSENLQQTFRKVATVAASVGAAMFAAKKAFDFAEEGAQLLRLEQAGENLARSFGTSMEEIVAAVDKAANGTVARSDIILASNKAMTLGVASSAEQMAQLMEIAAVRAKAMGLTTTQAFSDIVTGIGRMSPMILDNLGILTGGEATFEAYAESIGKAADELTDAEKKQALFEKVLKETQPQLDLAKRQADDLATSYEQLNVNVKNFTDSLKTRLAAELPGILNSLNEYFNTQETINMALQKWGVRKKLFLDDFVFEGEVIAKNTDELKEWIDAQLEADAATKKRTQSDVALLNSILDRMNAEEGEVITLDELIEKNKELREEQEKLTQIEIDQKFENLKNLMRVDLTQGFEEFKSKVQELNIEITTLEGLRWVTDEQKQDLADARSELDKTTQAWREHTAQVLFSIAEQALAVDGLTEEEVKALSKTAEELGLVDPGFAALTEKVFEDAEALKQAGDQSDLFAESMSRTSEILNSTTLDVENLSAVLDLLPDTKVIDVMIRVNEVPGEGGGTGTTTGTVGGTTTTTDNSRTVNTGDININNDISEEAFDGRMREWLGG